MAGSRASFRIVEACDLERTIVHVSEARRAEILAIIKKDRTKVFWERLWVVQDPSFGPTGFRVVEIGIFDKTFAASSEPILGRADQGFLRFV